MFGWLVNLVLWLLSYVRGAVAALAGENAGKSVDWLSWKISGKHKLQRICSKKKGLDKMKLLESCLEKSRHEEFKRYRQYVDVKELGNVLIRVKEIKPARDPEFIARCNITFYPLCQINALTASAVQLKQTKYDSENEEHEMLLLSLWNCLQPDRPLDDRISDMWGDIGFQGHDPATDFRGMGMLGLTNLLYLAKHKPHTAPSLLSASNHPQYGFSLAITSINLTAVMLNLLESGALRYHFYYKCMHGGDRNLTITDLNEVFCSILSEFVQYYQAQKPESIMEFNVHKAAYAELLHQTLLSDNPYLQPVE